MTKNRFSKIIILTIIWTFIVQPFLYIINTWPIEKAVAADIYANSIVKTVSDDWSNEPTSGETGEAKGTLIGKLNSLSDKLDDLKLFAFLDNNKINLDAYDLSQLLIYKNVATRLNTDLNLMAQYKASGQVPQSILDDLKIQSLPTYDIRTIQALIKLVTPKELGGGGREYIKVSSIIKGFRSDKQAQSGAETSQEQLAEDSENYYSPHNTGQAADITQIDYLRGTRYTKVTTTTKGLLGNTDSKTQDYFEKLPKIPIDVSWQGGGLNSSGGGSLNSKSMNGLFEMPLQFISSGLQGWLADQGIDSNNLKVNSNNLANLPFSIALPQLATILGLPDTYTTAGTLSANLKKTGGIMLADSTGGNLLTNGLSGSTTKESYLNLGREKITESLGLASGSLAGNNPQEIISQIGHRKMEEELGIGKNVLINISGADDLKQKIGQGLIEITFSLESGSFSSNDLTAIKTKLAAKWSELTQNTTLADNRLGIAIGETQKLINGSISVAAYKQEIGQTILDNLIATYSPKMIGSSLGIEQPLDKYKDTDKFVSWNNLPSNPELQSYFDQSLFGKFLKGDNAVFYDIGAETFARAMGTEIITTDAYGNPLTEVTSSRSYFKDWLKNGTVPRISKDGADYASFDLETMAAKIGLRTADLENIFIKNDTNLRNETYYRLGYSNFTESIATAKTTSDTSWGNFYVPRLENINNLAKSLKLANTPGIIQDIKKYNSACENSFAQELKCDPEAYARSKMPAIQTEIANLEAKSSNDKINELRLNVNEIIEGRELINVSKLKPADLTFSNPLNLSSDFNKTLLDTLQNNKGSVDNLLTQIGAQKWAGILGIDNSDDLISIAKAADKNPSNASAIIENKLTSGILNNLATQINNGMSTTNYPLGSYQVNGTDMANFFAGNSGGTFIKIGSPIINQAMQFPAGMGLAEYYQNGNLDAEALLKDGGICRLYGFLGLGTPDIQKGQNNEEKIANLTRAYAENQLGLARGSLSTGSFDELLNKNTKERALLAFGIEISADILLLKDKNPTLYQQKIDNLVNEVKNTHSPLWSNSQISSPIQQALAKSDTGITYENLRDLLDGKITPGELGQFAKDTIGHKISENNPDGSSKLKDYLGLVIDYASGADNNAISQLGDAFSTGNTGRAFDILASVTSANIDLKLNLGDQTFTVGKGVFSELLHNPQKAPQLVLSRGMSLLSSMIRTGDNNTTSIIKDILAGIEGQVTTEPLNLGNIIPSEQNVFSVLYKHGVGNVKISGTIAGFSGSMTVDLLHPLQNLIDTSGIINPQQRARERALADLVNTKNGLITDQIGKGTGIPKIDLKDVNQTINDNLKFYDGEVSNAIRCWSATGLQSAYNSLIENSKSKPGDINPQDVLSYETIRSAYLDPLLKYPIATDKYRDINLKINDWEKGLGIKLSDSERKEIIDAGYKEEMIAASKLAQKSVRYASIDLAIYKLGNKDKWMSLLGPGFARTMMEGNAAAKSNYFGSFLGRAVNNLTDLDPTVKTFLQEFVNNPNNPGFNSGLQSAVGAKVDQLFNKWTGASGSGLGRGLLSYIQNPNTSGTQITGDLVNSQISGMLDTTLKLPAGTTTLIYKGYDEYQKSLNLYHNAQNPATTGAWQKGVVRMAKDNLNNTTTNLCMTAATIALSKTFNDIDGKLGLPAGTTSTLVSAAAYSMIAHTSFATALTKLVPKTNFSVVGMALAIGIGLLTGSITPTQAVCMVAGAMVGSMVGRYIGTLFGGPLGSFIGQVIGQVIGTLVTDILVGKPEVTVTSTILYTAGGYYPYYEKERSGCLCGDKNSYQEGKSCDYNGREQSDCDNLQIANGQHLDGVDEIYNQAIQNNKIINSVAYEKLQKLMQQYDIIPSMEVDLPSQVPGAFNGENNENFSAGMKPAVDYKIKVLLGNLLTIDDNRKQGDLTLLPTQIQTYQKESIQYWNDTKDRVYGDGTTGSADKRLETSRKGIGYNLNLFDRIHFGY